MIDRNMVSIVKKRASQFPVVTITGPRQSGKTTLCRTTFPNKSYVSLEAPDARLLAIKDARTFLAQFPRGAIIDEIQHAPDLLSYIQVIVDEHNTKGEFIVTGSQNFALMANVSQSLAGRTALIELLAPSNHEVHRFRKHPENLFETLWYGAYPAFIISG
jgi:hypothetical protein